MTSTETSLKDNMMTTELHPWLSTPEAQWAADNAPAIPEALLPRLAEEAGIDALQHQAHIILTECAMPPRNDPRYSGQITQAHVGSMHSWPEADRAKYAVRVVGYALNNWLRTRHML